MTGGSWGFIMVPLVGEAGNRREETGVEIFHTYGRLDGSGLKERELIRCCTCGETYQIGELAKDVRTQFGEESANIELFVSHDTGYDNQTGERVTQVEGCAAIAVFKYVAVVRKREE